MSIRSAVKFNGLTALCCLLLLILPLLPPQHAAAETSADAASLTLTDLASQLRIGDLVFIGIAAKPFREVAILTDTWTNHVGVVVDVDGPEPLIAESTIPVSRTTTLSRFVGRSQHGRVAVTRLPVVFDSERTERLQAAVERRAGVLYDTGFNLHSSRQFCSRYVREVIKEAAGVQVGETETFAALLARHPDANLAFWRLWYFGRIPWQRETVTPASLLHSTEARPVFDGTVTR